MITGDLALSAALTSSSIKAAYTEYEDTALIVRYVSPTRVAVREFLAEGMIFQKQFSALTVEVLQAGHLGSDPYNQPCWLAMPDIETYNKYLITHRKDSYTDPGRFFADCEDHQKAQGEWEVLWTPFDKPSLTLYIWGSAVGWIVDIRVHGKSLWLGQDPSLPICYHKTVSQAQKHLPLWQRVGMFLPFLHYRPL